MKKLLPVLIVLLVVALVVGTPVWWIYGTVAYSTITVTHRERVVKSDHSYYLIYTAEGETFTVQDAWCFFNWHASDTYGSLNEGQKYKVKVNEKRFSPFSWYRNILVNEGKL